MNEKRIYRMRLADYLTARGFKVIRTVQDIKNINYKNWIFEESPQLEAAINDYIKSNPKVRKDGKSESKKDCVLNWETQTD